MFSSSHAYSSTNSYSDANESSADSIIYELRTDIQKLEFELDAERFHNESIPKRIKMTKSQLIYRFIIIAFVTGIIITLIYQMINGIPHLNNSYSAAIFLIVFPLITVAACVLDGFLLYGALNELDLLHGANKKSILFGASNYTEELVNSNSNLEKLTKELADKRQQLKNIISSSIHQGRVSYINEEVALNLSELNLTAEELYDYAYGTWGEDRESVKLKLNNGSYLQEKENLETEILNTERYIIELARRKARIEENYKIFRSNFIILLLLIALFAVFQFIFSESRMTQIIVSITAFAICVVFGFLLIHSNKENIIHYYLDHHFNIISEYAYDHKLSPTKDLKKKADAKLHDAKKRLAYVTELLQVLGNSR